MRFSFLCLFSISCTNIAGQWEGSCGEEDPLGLDLDVSVDEAGELEGEGVMTFDFLGFETSVELELEGTRDGRDFVIELDQAGWKLILEGEKSDGLLVGSCQLYGTVVEESLWSEGPFELDPAE